MLAQNFKTAEDLALKEVEKDALIKTLVFLETKKIKHVGFCNEWSITYDHKFTGHFNMATWGRAAPCGTVACIGGTADRLGNLETTIASNANSSLRELFEPSCIGPMQWVEITTEQAATALRSYLTTGDARWDLALNLCPQETARD
jgi:hypothetical protein